jgi:mannose-6-phosphate isomerase-like protein (cupin superfamily)
MPEPGQEIEGAGSRLRFVETAESSGGERVVVEVAYDGAGSPPPVHLHPSQEERFEVLEGEMHVVVDGERAVRRAGERYVIPAGAEHSMWAEGAARQRWETAPALRTDAFLETAWGFQTRTPSPEEVGAFLERFAEEVRFVGPPPER